MKIKQRIIRYLIVLGARLVALFVLLMPYGFAVWLGGFLGGFAGRCLKKARKETLNNLKFAFPEKTEEELSKIADGMYRHFGKTLFEFLSTPKLSKKDFDRLIEYKGFEHIDEALKQNKSVLFLTGHIGNWELMGMYVALSGYPVNVIARRIYDDRLNEMLVGYRAKKRVKTLLRTESVKHIIRVFKNKETMAMLIDQDTDVRGCFVDFFGKKAYTPSGLAEFAMKYDTVVLPAFCQRISNKKHRVTIYPALELICTGDDEKDIIANTQKYTNITEEVIRNCPEQWVWVHNRWKKRPSIN